MPLTPIIGWRGTGTWVPMLASPRGTSRGLDPTVDAELEAMAREHREHERPLGELVAACDEIARAPERLSDLAPVVSRAAAELDRHFVEHLGREEAFIFPAMRRLLERSADAAIVREIRARRGVVEPTPA